MIIKYNIQSVDVFKKTQSQACWLKYFVWRRNLLHHDMVLERLISYLTHYYIK